MARGICSAKYDNWLSIRDSSGRPLAAKKSDCEEFDAIAIGVGLEYTIAQTESGPKVRRDVRFNCLNVKLLPL